MLYWEQDYYPGRYSLHKTGSLGVNLADSSEPMADTGLGREVFSLYLGAWVPGHSFVTKFAEFFRKNVGMFERFQGERS